MAAVEAFKTCRLLSPSSSPARVFGWMQYLLQSAGHVPEFPSHSFTIHSNIQLFNRTSDWE
ncbi:hypothetical protein RUW02_11400 [Bacillus sp. IG6]|nr:hypothetical protein [Bacillus sp. IG6]